MLIDVSVLVRTILKDLSDSCVTRFSPTKAASVGAKSSKTDPATIAPLIRSLQSKAPSVSTLYHCGRRTGATTALSRNTKHLGTASIRILTDVIDIQSIFIRCDRTNMLKKKNGLHRNIDQADLHVIGITMDTKELLKKVQKIEIKTRR